MSKKRVTDLQECAEVVLPKPRNEKVECEMEIIRNIIMEEFEAQKTKQKEKLKAGMKKKYEPSSGKKPRGE